MYRAVAKRSDADFRPLQVRQDAHVTAVDICLFANAAGHLCVVSGGAVAEIEAEHIDPGADEPGDHIVGLAGRTDGGDNLGSSVHPERHVSFRSGWSWHYAGYSPLSGSARPGQARCGLAPRPARRSASAQVVASEVGEIREQAIHCGLAHENVEQLVETGDARRQGIAAQRVGVH